MQWYLKCQICYNLMFGIWTLLLGNENIESIHMLSLTIVGIKSWTEMERLGPNLKITYWISRKRYASLINTFQAIKYENCPLHKNKFNFRVLCNLNTQLHDVRCSALSTCILRYFLVVTTNSSTSSSNLLFFGVIVCKNKSICSSQASTQKCARFFCILCFCFVLFIHFFCWSIWWAERPLKRISKMRSSQNESNDLYWLK